MTHRVVVLDALSTGHRAAAAVLGRRPRRSGLEQILERAWRWHRAHARGYRS